eukprot:Blabericola_migrator_1__6628@NODE_3344_length_1841_cov_46_182074_g2088_i0_p1_GENE_NODE_3344_length_1841_cov_46_182074_g2088_i0NODE_3344_length_1841_cov_46_182074_g2088_i0_p1_ORF_typecomplete_len308_score55_18NIF/PF03031_18/3_1e25CbiA/PF01656_23/1_1e03CbiA/PF01656_23/1_2e03CbiA/PF01656_23/0_12_NODE_3344_length_1841_cov_46_182074_g2088_i07321655
MQGSDWDRVQAAQKLRRLVTKCAILGTGLYWAFGWHKQHVEAGGESLGSRVDRSLDRIVDWTDDAKETIARVGRYLMTRKVKDNDPLISSMLRGNPFRRIKRNDLPLLPDVEHLNFPRPMPTLLVDLDKVVSHLTYDPCFGWRVRKRPFADKLFREMMFNYEIVVWSQEPFPIAQNLVTQWGLPVMGVLHKEHCTKLGKDILVKDLDKLGRDLSRVVIVDTDPQAFGVHKENGITIDPYDPTNLEDKDLEGLRLYLKDLATHEGDLRPVIKAKGQNTSHIKHLVCVQETEQGVSDWFRGLAQSILGR